MLPVSASLMLSPTVARINSLIGVSSSLKISSKGAGTLAVSGASIWSIATSTLCIAPSVADSSCAFSEPVTAPIGVLHLRLDLLEDRIDDGVDLAH